MNAWSLNRFDPEKRQQAGTKHHLEQQELVRIQDSLTLALEVVLTAADPETSARNSTDARMGAARAQHVHSSRDVKAVYFSCDENAAETILTVI